jgi:hypothetical protein
MKPTYRVDDLLASRSRIAVLRVLHGVDVPLNASQIAERTGLTRPAVASVLTELAAPGVVRSSPAGRATVHWIERDNTYVQNIIDPLFEAERHIPEDLVDDLAWAFHDLADSVVLFGSYARGDQGSSSDVDVALVASDDSTRTRLESTAADYAVTFRGRFGATLSYLVYTRDEARGLSNTSPQLFDAIRDEGVVVSGLDPWDWPNDVEG